jgi:coenzyme F420-0:L-glutamate ligase/coenzyme F420-1:gamma-L-glutamate ligase
MRLEIIGITGIGEVQRGDDLGRLLVETAEGAGNPLLDRDVLVVTHKVVSKAEGRVVVLADLTPSVQAQRLAKELGFEAHHTEVILGETARIVRKGQGVLVCETRHGFVCANAGVDRSNAGGKGLAILLPEDPDASAQRIRARVQECGTAAVGVVISDTFGRPWREGGTNVAIGVAGLRAIRDYRGQVDPHGYELHGSLLAEADELAAAGELVMGKLDRVPAAVIRGYPLGEGGTMRDLLRQAGRDLFR